MESSSKPVANPLQDAFVLWVVVAGIVITKFSVYLVFRQRMVLEAVSDLAIAGVVLCFALRDPAAVPVLRRPRPRMVELTAVIAIVSWLLLWMLPEQFTVPVASMPHLDPNLTMASWHFWGIAWIIVIYPALAEEALFRGFLLSRFSQAFPAVLAVALQAVLYAVWHFDYTMAGREVVVGVLLGTMRLACGGIWPCILWHAAWNGWILYRSLP
jgi:membrane protease YdiL (CAAX protease family)